MKERVVFEHPFFEVEEPDMTLELTNPGSEEDTSGQIQEGD
jgi:hypothetical protein